MIVFPNCKINLGLNITSKRNDGYHNLETVLFPINLKDVLEIIRLEKSSEIISLSCSGVSIDNAATENICTRAFKILQTDFPSISAIKLHLHKAIPIGAGLGGGSADGAFTLLLLNEVFHLNLSTDQLINYALQLGSDCPFFILNKPCFATSRGEMLEEIDLDLSSYKIVVINPGIHISTASAFSTINPAQPAKSIKQVIKQHIETWKDELKNDFETPIFHQYPEIGFVKNTLYDAGAVFASMSGSGSSVFGIFNKSQKLSLNFPEHYFIHESVVIN